MIKQGALLSDEAGNTVYEAKMIKHSIFIPSHRGYYPHAPYYYLFHLFTTRKTLDNVTMEYCD